MIRRPLIGTFVALLCTATTQAQEKQQAKPVTKKTQPVARLLWQDDSERTLKWSDVNRDPQGLALEPQKVEGFPSLDPEQQSFVQMEETNGIVVVGIHDTDDGNFQSGWVALKTGVTEEEHGDHSHWYYDKNPSIAASQLDKNQGNPAHVYNYQDNIFLANDKKNGFTILSTVELSQSPSSSLAQFFSGGGNHITLAAVDRSVCYATWADREGDHVGRVDVVSIGKKSKHQGYSLKLPTGGLHGATTNSGKVFFAPSDGICWLEADKNLSRNPSSVQIHHLSLGEDPATGKPLRTGAFSNHRNYVLFTTGTKDSSALCMIDAKSTEPSITRLPLPVAEGLAWTTPTCIKTPSGRHFALIFGDRRGSEAQESLTIVDLDPNLDNDFSDAKVAKSLPIGNSKIVGHGGHHEACFSSSGRWAFITNPGDGSIWVLSLITLAIESQQKVGGTPTRIVAIGG